MGPDSSSSSRFRLQLVDIAAIVVGYGLAAVCFRAFWPRQAVSPAIHGFAIGFYAWLGLAMSGPLLLLRQRRAMPPTDPGHRPPERVPSGSSARTWAEIAWLVIGVYWIVLGAFVVPGRLRSFRPGDTILLGLVPFFAGLVLRLFGPAAGRTARDPAAWTHHVAVFLLLTWSIAWVCLIVVGGTVL